MIAAPVKIKIKSTGALKNNKAPNICNPAASASQAIGPSILIVAFKDPDSIFYPLIEKVDKNRYLNL